ncbi:hypothetical protein ACQ4LE_010658 [Meloidogyne hapla]|uniref:Dimer_Tnp_hAT domain-containing protein n=1 Tax=Meloidogyne hapla TaxID=6305 RepID=A0A1I8B497_MELHA
MEFERGLKKSAISKNLAKLGAGDFEMLRLVCPILEVFDSVTLRFSKETSTASEVLPILKRIREFFRQNDKFTESLHGFIQTLSNSINDRVKKLVDNKLLRISTLLDPRYAFDELIFNKTHWGIVIEDLKEFANKVLPDDKLPVQLDVDAEMLVESPESDCLSENSKESIHYDIFHRPTSTSPGVSSLSSRIEVQLASFRVTDRVSHDTDIFQWWKVHGAQFPDLFNLARIVHSIPATSISSERLFSKAGLLYADSLRNRLSADMADKILVIKANLNEVLLAPSTETDDDFSFVDTDDYDFC